MSTIPTYRRLSEISHDDAKCLLLQLGCQPFSDDCNFILDQLSGADLAEVESHIDLTHNGVTANSDLRVKKIFRELCEFKNNGVPWDAATNQPVTGRSRNAEPASGSLTIGQEDDNSWNVSDRDSSKSTSTSAVYSAARTPEQVGSIISTLVKEYAADLAANLLECAYSMTFPSRPSDVALDLWIEAYEEREKVPLQRSAAGRDEQHKKANVKIEEALNKQFWLPFRHACIWNYSGTLASVDFRLEYEVLRESFRAMERDGQNLTPRFSTIKLQLDSIMDEISLIGNEFRISICRGVDKVSASKQDCRPGCLKVTGQQKCYYCCVEHVSPTSGSVSKEFKLDDHKELCQLPQDVRHWDPCFSFLSVINWPAAPFFDSSSSQKKNNHGSYWRVNQGSRPDKFFHARCNYCRKFAPLPKKMVDRNIALFGNTRQMSTEDQSLDISSIFRELLTLRHRLIGHGGMNYNAEDVWWAFTTVVMAAHVIEQQSTEWLKMHDKKESSTVMQSFPSFDACQTLKTRASDILQKSLEWDDVLKSGYNCRLHDNPDVDYYREFVLAVNKFKAGEIFLVLILPPLPADFIPSSLAAVPWDLVVDFSDLGISTEPTESMAWKVLKNASGTVTKDHHKVSFNSSRIYRQNIDDLCEYLEEMNPVDVPWWQVTASTPSGLLSELFDDDGRVVNDYKSVVEDVSIAIGTVIRRIFDTRVLRNRSVQLILPMYSVYEKPCLHSTLGRSSWFVEVTQSVLPSTRKRNFATPYFIQKMLHEFTFSKADVKCSVLYQLDSPTHAPIAGKMDFLSSETGLRSGCVPQLLYLPIEVMMLRYRMSFIDVDDHGGSYGDALCIYRFQGTLTPFVRRSTLSSSSSSSGAGQLGMDLRTESHENISKLHMCGIDLLHTRSPEYSLKEFESKSFFSMLLNDTSSRGRSNPLLRSTTKQALALLKFYFSYPPAWALFCEETMAQDRNLWNPPFVVRRDFLFRLLTKKAELLKHGRTTTDSTLIVRHRRRCGGTTLVRQFAWSVAFNEWHSVVMVLDERWNTVGSGGVTEAMQILKHSLEPGSYLIIIADRNITSEPLKRLCDQLQKLEFHFLLIRLQQLPETTTAADAATMASAAAPANLSFQTYGKVDTFTIDPETVENRKHIAQDMDDIVNCMFQMAKYFDPTVDVNVVWEQYKKHGNLENRFKKIFFLGLLRFVHMSSEPRVPRGMMSMTTTSVAERSVYNTVISKWMEDVVGLLYRKIDNEDLSSKEGYTTAAAVRALMYIAIIELCSDDSLKLEISSLRIVFNDPTTAEPLFTAWEAKNIENVVLSKAFVNAQRTLNDLGYKTFTPVFGSLLPFIELLQQQTAASAAAAAAAAAAAPEPASTTCTSTAMFPGTKETTESLFSFASPSSSMQGEVVEEGSATSNLASAKVAPADESATSADLDRFPLFRQFRAVKDYVHNSVYSLSSSTSPLAQATKSIIDSGVKPKEYATGNIADILAEVLALPSRLASSHDANSALDQLDDVSDLLWGEFLYQRNGSVSFVSNDVAEMFLVQALRHEEARYRSRRSSTSPPEIPQVSTLSTQVYILAMSLLHTISLDRDTMQTLRDRSFIDIQHEETPDASLAWRVQHLFCARQYIFDKDKVGDGAPSPSMTAAASTSASNRFPKESTGSNGRSGTKYVRKYQRWSWLLVHLQTSQATNAKGGTAAGDNSNASMHRSAFESLEMKFLIASHVAYTRYWRLSSAIARLMQYQLWRLTDDIAQLRARIEDQTGQVVLPTLHELDKWMTSMYHRGIQLYLASTARMILAVDEINRVPGVVNKSDGDHKKFSGTMDQLGNCIKAFICLNREAIYITFLPLQGPSLSAAEAYGPFAVNEVQRTTMLKKFYGCSACLLMALGNMARYFYGLSIRVVSQPLGFGDEVDGWLHVLEGLQALQRASLTHPRPVQLDLHQQLSLTSLTSEVMIMFCGQQDAQWIKGAGPIWYSNQNASFDKFVGPKMYYSTHIYSTNEIHDMIHSKLADFNEANMRMLEEKNKDFSYFDQNLGREDLFIVRLADVAAGTGRFTSWKQLFEANVKELSDLPPDDPLVPYKERSIARFAYCMWREQALNESGSTKGGEAWLLMNRIITSKSYHRFMVSVNQSPIGQYMVETVVRAIVHCVTRLTMKYPIRLMTQLVELLSFVSIDSIQRVVDNRHGDIVQYLPYTVELLMPMMKDWESHAREDVALRRSDEATVAAAVRFRTLLSFLSLWNKATKSSEQLSDLLKHFHENNGHYDTVQKRWVAGTLATTYKPYVHIMERYVLRRPMAIHTASEGLAMFGMPLCIRKQFSIIEECMQEQQSLDGTLTPLEERYSSVLVGGVVLHLLCNDVKNRYEGAVRMEGSGVTLPFYYNKNEYAVLEQHRCTLVVGHPCTFYITFLPWRVEAYAVQSTESVASAPQQVSYVHGKSGEVPRLPTAMIFVGDKKMDEITRHEGRRELSHRRSAAAAASTPAVSPESEADKQQNDQKEPSQVQDVPAVSKVTTKDSLWGTKKLVLKQDKASAALQEDNDRAVQASLCEGVSFIEVFALDRRNGHKDVIHCHALDDPLFGQLLLFRHAPSDMEDDKAIGPGTIIRFTTIADLYGEENVATVLAGGLCDEDGVIAPPIHFRRQVYGHLIFSNDPSKQSTVNLFSPYKLLPPPIPASCSLIIVENFVKDKGYCLPCSDETRCVDGVGGSGHSAGIRILVHDACTTKYAPKPRAYGEATSVEALRPKVVRTNEVLIGGPSDYHRRLFLLWNLHTMSLMAVREGLLVLVAQMDAQGKAVWNRFSLAVVYFPQSTNDDCIRRELEETWRRTKGRLSESGEDLQINVRRSNAVKFSSIAAPPSVAGTSAATVNSEAKAPAVAANSKQLTSLPNPGSTKVSMRPPPSPAAALTTSKLAASGTEAVPATKPTWQALFAAEPPLNSSGGDDGWKKVSSVKNKTVARPATKALKCTSGLQCQYGATCPNGSHPEDVQRVFACFNTREMRLRYKFQLCTRKGAHEVAECFYYHEKDPHEKTEKFCSNCLTKGHLAIKCPPSKKK